MTIAVVDTGGANLRSVTNALARLGADWRLTSVPSVIAAADKVILPGVGAAADAMQRLQAAGLLEVLPRLQQPVLGICLGMQLLFSGSDEGNAEGLGLIPGRVIRLAAGPGLRIPHLGWNSVRETVPGADPLFTGIEPDACFYFVHGYQAPKGPWVSAWTDHGGPVPAAVSWKNVRGVQFHPEKSQAAGAKLLENFLRL